MSWWAIELGTNVILVAVVVVLFGTVLGLAQTRLAKAQISGLVEMFIEFGGQVLLGVVIIAVGTGPNPLVQSTTPDLATNKWGYIEVDDNGMTSKPGVFAGGDIIRGSATVILAMGAGKGAGYQIDRFLRGADGSGQPPMGDGKTDGRVTVGQIP